MGDPLETLIGQSEALPEVEDEFNPEITEAASIKYDIEELLKSMSTKDFKYIFQNILPGLKKHSIETQRKICTDIIKTTKDHYDFEFQENVDFDNQNDFNIIYDFLEFINYGYIDFLVSFWQWADLNKFMKMDLLEYFKTINFDLIIDICIKENSIHNNLVLGFIKGTERSVLQKFIIDGTELNRVEVLVGILKKRNIIKENKEDEQESDN